MLHHIDKFKYQELIGNVGYLGSQGGVGDGWGRGWGGWGWLGLGWDEWAGKVLEGAEIGNFVLLEVQYSNLGVELKDSSN